MQRFLKGNLKGSTSRLWKIKPHSLLLLYSQFLRTSPESNSLLCSFLSRQPSETFPTDNIDFVPEYFKFSRSEELTSTITCSRCGELECVWWILAFSFSPSKDGGGSLGFLVWEEQVQEGERAGVAAKGGNTADIHISNTGTGKEGDPIPAHSFSKCSNVRQALQPCMA